MGTRIKLTTSARIYWMCDEFLMALTVTNRKNLDGYGVKAVKAVGRYNSYLRFWDQPSGVDNLNPYLLNLQKCTSSDPFEWDGGKNKRSKSRFWVFKVCTNKHRIHVYKIYMCMLQLDKRCHVGGCGPRWGLAPFKWQALMAFSWVFHINVIYYSVIYSNIYI